MKAVLEGSELTPAEGVTVRAFDLRAFGTRSELHDEAVRLFGELEDYGGGFVELRPQFLLGGRTRILVIAWVNPAYEGMFPNV